MVAVATLATDEIKGIRCCILLCMRSSLFVTVLALWGLNLGAKKEEAESPLHCNERLSLPTQLQSFPVNINK